MDVICVVLSNQSALFHCSYLGTLCRTLFMTSTSGLICILSLGDDTSSKASLISPSLLSIALTNNRDTTITSSFICFKRTKLSLSVAFDAV